MGKVASELQSLPFGALIGGPLDAAIEAQGKAAVSSIDFIRAIGLNDDGSPKNIEFTASKGEDTIAIKVPILTIVPIPFIRIDDMTIDFKASVTSTTQKEDSTVKSFSAGAKLTASAKYFFAKASLEASISSKKDSKSTKDSKYSVETTIDIHVHAVQDELPAGLAKMLNLLTDTIMEPPAAGTGKEVVDKPVPPKSPKT